MKRFIYVFMFLISIVGTSAYAHGYEPALDREELLALYSEAWETEDEVERKAVIRKIWLRRGVHQNPFNFSKGLDAISDEIAAFQGNFPGSTLRFENVREVDNHIIADFILENEFGDAFFTGVNYFKTSKRGRLIRVVGFF